MLQKCDIRLIKKSAMKNIIKSLRNIYLSRYIIMSTQKHFLYADNLPVTESNRFTLEVYQRYFNRIAKVLEKYTS